MMAMLLLSSPAAAQTDEATVDFYGARCGACHGVDGAGGAGPSLVTSTMTIAEIADVIAVGASGMPGFSGDLDAATLDALSAYVATFQAATGAAPAPGGSASGSGIYFAYCAGCHGTGGGGGSGPSLDASTLSVDEVTAVIAGGASGMPGYSDRLAAAEIAAVAEFVLDLPGATAPPATTAPTTTTTPQSDSGTESGADLYRVNCAACHGADGAGGAATSLLGSSLDEAGMIEIITSGEGAMPGFGATLTPEQIGAIAIFVEGLGSGAAPPTTQPGESTTTEEAAGPDGDDASGAPSFWGPLLATLGTLIVVTGGLSINRRRHMVSPERREEATE